ncbi:hypothetical protein [Nonomuraea sp. NPDC050202]|uniref:hypothetical protein n=1 Tax=Nonomuraea sp. NPDC050202 TaxID=3155035 RepID=UPI0033D5F4E7
MTWLPSLRLAVPLVLVVAGGAVASAPEPAGKAPEPAGKLVMCRRSSSIDTISMSCGDPELEARMRARMLNAEQASAAGCRPLRWGDVPEPSPRPYDPGEEEPATPPKPLDPAVAARVDGAWDRIERWLGAHASATLRGLAFPASPADLARSQAGLRPALPDALYASLLRHDGPADGAGSGLRLPGGHELISAMELAQTWQSLCTDLILAGDPEAAGAGSGRWHGSLVPFASTRQGRHRPARRLRRRSPPLAGALRGAHADAERAVGGAGARHRLPTPQERAGRAPSLARRHREGRGRVAAHRALAGQEGPG